MGKQTFNPIGFLKILTPKERKRWKRDAQKRELLIQNRLKAKAKKRLKARREEALKEQCLESAFIQYLRVESLNPNRKSLCRVPKSPSNGFKRPHYPNPKNKIRVDRSKIRKPFSD
jgi:hypothetical protein